MGISEPDGTTDDACQTIIVGPAESDRRSRLLSPWPCKEDEVAA